MSTIFALFPGTIPSFDKIEKTLNPGYSFVHVGKVESLAKHRDTKGVVLLGGEPERVNSMVGIIRSVAPKLGCVIVIEENQLDKLDPAVVNLSDILIEPFRPLEICSRINMAMHMSELHHIVEESAQIDEVTGLHNYKFFLKRLGEEMSLSRRHLSPVTCVIIGISYYDVYMDSYGYQFVADLMKQVAEKSKESVRIEDVAARLSDSEIAFVLPRSTEKGALSQVTRIINKTESVPLDIEDKSEQLTLKAGVAGFPSPDAMDMDPDTLIRYARHALHSARCSESKRIQLFSEMKPYVG